MINRRNVLKGSAAAAVGIAITAASEGSAHGAEIDRALRDSLAQDPAGLHPVVVTYRQSGPPTAAQVSVLETLGITTGLTMQALPIAGILATSTQIEQLANNPDVLSIVPNSELTYYNYESREISGVKRAVDNPGDFKRSTPFSGHGVTVVVNDSGVDATHGDLPFRSHVIENVHGTQNLVAEVGNEIFGKGIVPVTYIEGVPNTDLGSGHGTHCAGTIGGSGARSGGLYRGVAPGADLVGYGSGAVLLILDAVGGLDYAAINQDRFLYPIRVTSNSWGGSGEFDPAHPVNVATYELYKRGIVSVFAAGNDGPGEDTHNAYSWAPWVISVGAGTKSGELADFSSRGKRGQRKSFTMPDGKRWTAVNEPNIVATGVDVISTRDPLAVLPALSAKQDAEVMEPGHLPFYTHMSGTSMATPHVAGIVALLFEANPALTPAEVDTVLRRTATNMTGRASWEVGAGHINAYAALMMASKIRQDWGKTVNSAQKFNSNAVVTAGATVPFSFDFSPVGATGEQKFTVAKDVAWVAVRATIEANTLALVLTDPNGTKYASSIALPVLGDTVTTGAPGIPGEWTVSARGIGSLSGTDIDPGKVTNGYGVPGTVAGEISYLRSGGYTGLSDIANHPARMAIEFAVSHRLVDGYSDGRFRPDQPINRGEFAQFLVMGQSVRQSLPRRAGGSFVDLPTSDPFYPYAVAVTTAGGALRDRSLAQQPLLFAHGVRFDQQGQVNRGRLMYSLVQALALQPEAKAFTGPITAFYDGKRVPVKDANSLGPVPSGYAQLALDRGLINARFVLTQGEFDTQPTITAYLDGAKPVTRAAFAVASGRFVEAFKLEQ